MSSEIPHRTIDDVNYAAAAARVSKTMQRGRRFPDQVFQPGFGRYRFLEFSTAMSGSFWQLLKPLADAAGGSLVDVVAIEPDAADYYHRRFGHYGFFELPLAASAADYCAQLGAPYADSPADALLYHPDVVVWLSDSARWAAVGDRSAEIAVLAFHAGFEPEVEQMAFLAAVHLFQLDSILADVMSQRYRNGAVPAGVEQVFRQNYSA